MHDLAELLSFAHRLADETGAAICPLFRTPVTVDIKPDKSPVTLADREAERVMCAMIMQHYPQHGIIGEESGAYQPEAEVLWVLDPVDGTKSFLAGFPTFTTLISVVVSGVPVLGVINQPVTHERWVAASGVVATYNGKPLRTRTCPALATATLSTTSPHLFSAADAPLFDHVRRQAHQTLYGYDGYAYAQLASGFVDVIIESGLKPYDFCALRPVIEGAGGVITDWSGNVLTFASDGRVIAAGDKRTHQEVLRLINT